MRATLATMPIKAPMALVSLAVDMLLHRTTLLMMLVDHGSGFFVMMRDMVLSVMHRATMCEPRCHYRAAIGVMLARTTAVLAFLAFGFLHDLGVGRVVVHLPLVLLGEAAATLHMMVMDLRLFLVVVTHMMFPIVRRVMMTSCHRFSPTSSAIRAAGPAFG